jgi:hypothetical protein
VIYGGAKMLEEIKKRMEEPTRHNMIFGCMLNGIEGRKVIDDFNCLISLNDQLLEAVKAAYLKHHLGSDTIGWDELSNILLNALCAALGDKGYQDWADSVKR